MIHYGPAGALGSPQQQKREPDADCFRGGDVWQSPSGVSHRVTRVERGVAYLANEASGRTTSRPWDAIGAHSGRSWVRLSCGE